MPAGQIVQAEEVEKEKYPAPQLEQLEAPVEATYLPVGQLEQPEDPARAE